MVEFFFLHRQTLNIKCKTTTKKPNEFIYNFQWFLILNNNQEIYIIYVNFIFDLFVAVKVCFFFY